MKASQRRRDSDTDDSRRSKRKRMALRQITEDEINRYLSKKAEKKAISAAKKLNANSSLSSYSNQYNPFGDSNLNENFVWSKKIEREVGQGVPLEEFSFNAGRKRHKERMAEIEKVKKRREQKGLEKAQEEEERALLARERARAEADVFEKKEEEFWYSQSKIRSKIRLKEGRAKPIDLLTTYIEDTDAVLKGLTATEMEGLRGDIKMHLKMDRETPAHVQYWEAVLVLCDWELAEGGRRDSVGIHSSVEKDVMDLLEGKSLEELVAVQSEIESDMLSGEARVVEYWEAVLKRLPVYKAKACLKEIHGKMMLRKGVENAQDSDSDSDREHEHCMDTCDESDGEEGSFSPILSAHADDEAIDPEEDKAALERIAKKTMGVAEEGDAAFGPGAEVNLHLGPQAHWLHYKYRPRKPKYLNRVHTGYEWNKYNQTHYDHDSPPPKAVLGYKFNIFYPDMLDKTKAPGYTIEKDGDSSETCIIRFHAGPPYEDIAFRIVSKPWERSPKKGYKCTFDGRILHLYFNFARYRYRR